jgi:SAM-dependent methyltransferase
VADQVTAHAQQVQRLFDQKASTWADKYAQHGPLTGRLTQLAGAVGYGAPACVDVLDLGCGSGEMSRHLAAAGLRVTGCDISANMLAEAVSAQPESTVEWVRLSPDWQMLPFPAASFDALVASSVLEYVCSPALVLAECARVLRPGAVMLATVPDLGHPVRWLEGAARAMALVPGTQAVSGRWPRLGNYVTYLRLSRHRHRADWWSQAAARAGLLTVSFPPDPGLPDPLRLLTFQRSALTGDIGERDCAGGHRRGPRPSSSQAPLSIGKGERGFLTRFSADAYRR